jgi:hypothetical protein
MAEIILVGKEPILPETVKFTQRADGAYRCNREGDQSGVYISSAKYEGSVAGLRNVRGLAAQILPSLNPEDEDGAKTVKRLTDLVESTAGE